MKATHNPPVDVDPTPAVILRGAARYLQLHGWHQGTLYAAGTSAITPAACALGAIGMAAFGHRLPDPQDHWVDWSDYQAASNALDDYLTLTGAKDDVPDLHDIDADSPSVGDWNDAPARTATEVVAALNAAADEWERLHTPAGGDRS
jgi:hypothetical protein